MLVNGKNSFILCGDAETEAEQGILAGKNDLKADVLKIDHHGSDSATNEEFLDAVDPKYAVISCGRKNRYGHPHAELLKRLSDANIRTYITRDSGAVTVISDGEKMNIQEFTEKYRYAKESVYR